MKIEFLLQETFMNNVDPRRKQEQSDARMISEDHRAIANLSNQAIHQQYDAFKYQQRLAMFNQSDWKLK